MTSMTVPRMIVGGLLLILAGLMFFGLIAHVHVAPWARLLLTLLIAFVCTQVLFGKRLPGFSWRTKREIG